METYLRHYIYLCPCQPLMHLCSGKFSMMNQLLFLSGILLQTFCCFLSTSGQRIVTNDYPLGVSTYTFMPFETSYNSGIELVAGNRSTLTLNVKYFVDDPGPVCFLDIVPKDAKANISSWTKPCPRTPQQGVPPVGFWCLFGFSSDGNLLLKSGANVSNGVENGTVLWSSNTTGMGVQSLELLDTDPESVGNLVLYNANKEIVWRNIASNSGSEDYSCSYVDQAPVGAPLSTPDHGAPGASLVFSGGPAAAPSEFGTAPTPSAGRKLLQH